MDVKAIFDWTVDGAPGAKTPPEVLAGLGKRLLEAGFPVDRVVVFVRTLHPNIAGRIFSWFPGRPVVIHEASYAYLQAKSNRHRLAARVILRGKGLRRRIDSDQPPESDLFKDDLEGNEYTDYLMEPLHFINGEVHLITFATCKPEGFTDQQVADLKDLMRPFARVAEIYALNRTAANLLNTYVGNNAGERILAGKIQRGDTDIIQAVIWFSDLRGYTALSATLEPAEIIRVLNDLFDCQVPALARHGGEVLKFIGDGLFAIFPLEGVDRTPAEICDAALQAGREAFSALADLNKSRVERGVPEINFGLAYHIGEVAFGNIGGLNRLDFTCIGSAVNLAARLEGLTGRLGQSIVFSKTFADKTSAPFKRVGTFELKGVPHPEEVFSPEDAPAAP